MTKLHVLITRPVGLRKRDRFAAVAFAFSLVQSSWQLHSMSRRSCVVSVLILRRFPLKENTHGSGAGAHTCGLVSSTAAYASQDPSLPGGFPAVSAHCIWTFRFQLLYWCSPLKRTLRRKTRQKAGNGNSQWESKESSEMCELCGPEEWMLYRHGCSDDSASSAWSVQFPNKVSSSRWGEAWWHVSTRRCKWWHTNMVPQRHSHRPPIK